MYKPVFVLSKKQWASRPNASLYFYSVSSAHNSATGDSQPIYKTRM